MKNLRLFATEPQYETAKWEFEYPTVSYVEDTDTVHYMTLREKYTREYLTFEALEAGTFTLNIPANVNSTYMTSVSYSTDDGENWTTTNVDSTAQTITTPTINAGDKVLWKGVGKSMAKDKSSDNFSYFSSTGNFNVSGNIMSLLYGDEFVDQVTFPSGSMYNFSRLFTSNIKLISARDLILSATTVGSYGCYAMFYKCTSLTTAPELPATTVGPNCYEFMFYQCSSLVNLPSTLPTTTLADNCYKQMFDKCSALTSIPSGLLPATTLAPNCYKWMFENCTSLNNVPSTLLPATTLADSCYQSMFYGCTALTTAPELPATTLANSCYQNMFYNCSNLNYIKMLATDISASYCLYNWVQGVAATGTFVKNYQATWTTTGVNGVPTGWSVDVEASFPKNYDYFTTEAIDDSVFTFSIPSGIPTSTLNYVEYSVDNGQTWIKTNNVDSTAVTVITPTITAGNSVKWRCAARAISTSSDHSTFSSSGRYNVSGNIMSLVSGISEFSSVNALRRLFYNSTNLISAINLSLATTVASECYKQMFSGCTSLIAAPELPATTLIYNCYNGMFSGCTSLTTAPELPATTLANACYYQMFNGCTSLTTAPSILPATKLVSDCYNYMFQNCSTLNYIKAMFTTTPSTSYTRDWVNGVASSGTFVKNNAATWNETGVNGIPEGWAVETADS